MRADGEKPREITTVMAVNSDVRAVPLAFVRDVCYSLIMRGQEYVFCEPRSRGEGGGNSRVFLSSQPYGSNTACRDPRYGHPCFLQRDRLVIA